ncbi:hypothetical protein [Prosthecobacter sp.]|uniref:hypothetical protein n=1 Tax=Prosthecobacter sp. TaxID=1965333 RepID=UPI0037833680
MQWSSLLPLSLPLAALALTACKTLPAVPITTPKPLEVNLNMRLDVYQYRGDEPLDKEAAKNATEATDRMRNRMQEIQTLKNNQLIGEDHRGQLLIREVPPGDWGVQMKKAVAAENEDRMLLMRKKAKDSNRPLHEIEDEQWRLRTQQAGTGEWIEVPGASPGSFQWKRVGAATTPPVPQPAVPTTTTTTTNTTPATPATPASPSATPTTPKP